MKHFLAISLIVTTFSFSPTGNAERRLQIQSAHDKFDLTLTGKGGTVGGQTADLVSFGDLLKVITSQMETTCPKLTGKSDVSVKDEGNARDIYVDEGVVTDGQKCLTVSGDGLFYFPVHRDFLIGKKQGAIPLKNSIKVFSQGTKILDINRKGEVWAASSDQMLDWDFVDRFVNSIRDFSIRLRVQNGIAKDKPKLIVQIGGDSYEFYKVTNVMWAMKSPKAKWLVASDDWSFWYDFDAKVLEDRYADQIRFVIESVDKASKLSALSNLEGSWSRNLREMYHKLLLKTGEDAEVQEIALRRLRSKPAKETAGVMIEFLNKTQDEDMRKIATQILKASYPKGPIYNPGAPTLEREKTLRFWRDWWSQQSKTK